MIFHVFFMGTFVNEETTSKKCYYSHLFYNCPINYEYDRQHQKILLMEIHQMQVDSEVHIGTYQLCSELCQLLLLGIFQTHWFTHEYIKNNYKIDK